MNKTNKQNKIAFRMSAFVAFAMFIFEVEKTEGINLRAYEGVGHFLVLAGLGATGLVLFYLAGQLRAKNGKHANIVFFFSVCLRVFVGYYIETLESERVFASGERWTMHIGNISLAFIEVAYAFTQTKGDEFVSALKNAATKHKEELEEKLTELRSSQAKAMDELRNQLAALTNERDAAREQLNAANKKLVQQQNAVEGYSRIKECINIPQKRGTRYAMVTPDGTIVNCNAEGKQLNKINGHTK